MTEEIVRKTIYKHALLLEGGFLVPAEEIINALQEAVEKHGGEVRVTDTWSGGEDWHIQWTELEPLEVAKARILYEKRQEEIDLQARKETYEKLKAEFEPSV